MKKESIQTRKRKPKSVVKTKSNSGAWGRGLLLCQAGAPSPALLGVHIRPMESPRVSQMLH